MIVRLRLLVPLLAAIALVCTAVVAPAPRALATAIGQVIPLHSTPIKAAGVHSAGPTDAQCRAQIDQPCYSPQEIRTAYGLNTLIAKNGGKGQTIVIVDAFASDTTAADLARFDSDYGLPAPPSLRIIAPFKSEPFDPTDDVQVGWAEEAALDVQWSHALAPQAKIIVLTSGVDETEGTTGLPEFLQVERYAVAHHLGNIISQSWAATENSLFTKAGKKLIQQFNDFYRSATAKGVTFLGSTGDSGTANPGADGTTIYPFPTVNFPATSPYVTAVGGTSLYASTDGTYQHETVWNAGAGSATGGGISPSIAEPAYQRLLPRATQKLLNGHRGIPDVSFNADPNTGVPVFLGFLGPDNSGYYIFGGTSEGSPAWAGIVANLDQEAGRPLGLLNPTLYALGAARVLTPSFLRDVTVGDNSQPPIAGFSAGTGWDAATGWGTPHLNLLGGSLIKYTKHTH